MKDRFDRGLSKWKPRKKISYKGRSWNIKELLIYLANKVEELSRKRCRPNAKCLFKYHDYMDKKHIKKEL